MDILAKTIIQYYFVVQTMISPYRWDIFFMQELKNSPTEQCGKNTGPAICKLVEKIHSLSSEKYEFMVSDRVGSGGGVEQYVVFYKSSVARILKYEVFADPTGLFYRPPALAHVQIGLKTFWVVNIHTNPDNATKEITNLPKVVSYVNQTDTDILILGDFNADSPYFNENLSWPIVFSALTGDWKNLIQDNVVTTVSGSSKTYDRFLISPSLLTYFVTSSAAPFYFDKHPSGGFSMNEIMADGCQSGYLTCAATEVEAALKVSDHYPIQVTAHFDVVKINHHQPQSNNNEANSYKPHWISIILCFIPFILNP
jgi:hypothetical protein